MQFVDVRPPEQYNSKDHNGKGHIPGAINIHYANLMDNIGNMKSTDEIKSLVTSAGLDPNKETITYCHAGVSACVGFTALKEAGFENVRLYDGSWLEYSSKQETKEK